MQNVQQRVEKFYLAVVIDDPGAPPKNVYILLSICKSYLLSDGGTIWKSKCVV